MAFINFTLIVQAINFFIAFFLIKYLFFKPIVAQIQAEDDFQESLLNTVQANRTLVAQKEQELRAQWQSAQDHFKENTPSLKPAHFFSPRAALVKPEFDQSVIARTLKQATTELINRIDHVR